MQLMGMRKAAGRACRCLVLLHDRVAKGDVWPLNLCLTWGTRPWAGQLQVRHSPDGFFQVQRVRVLPKPTRGSSTSAWGGGVGCTPAEEGKEDRSAWGRQALV